MSTPPVRHHSALQGDDLVLTALSTAAGPLLWWFGSHGLMQAPVDLDSLTAVELAVASACAGGGALLAGWWFVALLGTAMAALGHRWRSARMVRWGQAVSPQFLRRVAASALGLNLLVAPGAWAGGDDPVELATASVHHGTVVREQAAAPAAALPQPGWIATSRGSGQQAAQGELPAPTWRPSAPAPPVPGSGNPARTQGVMNTSVTVRAGDCLWDIAAEELGPYATDLEIDRRWRQWYRLNRSVVGPDADILVPGTILTAPPVA